MSDAQNIINRLKFLDDLPLDEKIAAINIIREAIHGHSPFSSEPVDFVRWVKADTVRANDYNPNTVAPPEMELLRLSIVADGYTQPIVANLEDNRYEVIDGFHRNRVGKECADVQERVKGYLPLVQIRQTQDDKANRMASTIRHNRARGKHRVEAMSDIVVELKRRNWSDERISKNLGMEPDEILRLCQITGLAELFSDQGFSQSWDVEGEIIESDFQELTDDVTTYGDDVDGFRTVNTSDETRIFHTYENWECYKAGFYATTHPSLKESECKELYRDFLSDTPWFADSLQHVITEWKNSCQHYLTNASMNRIAWLGQAAACYSIQMPSTFRGGFSLLSEDKQKEANEVALTYLNKWLEANNRPVVTMDEAYSSGRQSDIY